MEEKLTDIITAHNRMIDTIQNSGMTCDLFRGMEIWHKIACEGTEIANAARTAGIDALVALQFGTITVREHCSVEMVTPVLTLAEMISSLEEQAQDRDCFVDENDPDCIFRQDAAALRAAAALLRKMEERSD